MERIKKYWREAVMAILVIVILLLYRHAGNLKEDNVILVNSKDSAFTEVRSYKDKNGDLISQINTYELTVKDLKQHGDELGLEISKLKAHIGSLNNLVGYWQGKAGFSGRDTILVRDTVVQVAGQDTDIKTFKWNNRFLFINGDYYPYDKEIALEYSYDIGGFDFYAYRRKQDTPFAFLKKKQLVADVKFGDQNMKVTEFKGVIIKEEKPQIYERNWFFALMGALGAFLALR